MSVLQTFKELYDVKKEKMNEIIDFKNNDVIKRGYPNIINNLYISCESQLSFLDEQMKAIKRDFFLNEEPNLNLNVDELEKSWGINKNNNLKIEYKENVISIKMIDAYSVRAYDKTPNIVSFLYHKTTEQLQVLAYAEKKFNVDFSILNKIKDRIVFSEFISLVDLQTNIIEIKFFRNGNVVINIRK